MKNWFICVLLASLACLSTAAVADELLIEHVEKTADIARPQLGQSMDEVRSQWGEPEQQYDPVGEPPITRWEYAVFTVYFEGDKVIHSVVKQQAADILTAEPEPAP